MIGCSVSSTGPYKLSKVAAERLRALPQSLHNALREMEHSQPVAESLSEHTVEWFLRNKRAEWRRCSLRVTPFEIEQYLRTL